jgi:hypothetical protein
MYLKLMEKARAITSFPSGFLITTPSTTGDFRASACAYPGPTV